MLTISCRARLDASTRVHGVFKLRPQVKTPTFLPAYGYKRFCRPHFVQLFVACCPVGRMPAEPPLYQSVEETDSQRRPRPQDCDAVLDDMLVIRTAMMMVTIMMIR